MPVRLGIVGADDHCLRQSRLLAENDGVRIVAVCDSDFSRAQNAARRFNAAPFKDMRRLLENETPDALLIGASPPARKGAEISGIARGCAILLEMPLTAHRKNLTELTRAAREHRALVCPALPLRYAKLVQVLQKTVKTRGAAPVAISVLAWGEAASLPLLSTHIVDTLRFCFDEVRSVTAFGKKYEDGVAWTLQLESGVFATVNFAPYEAGSGFQMDVQTRAARHRLNLENRDDNWHQQLTSFLPDETHSLAETRQWTHDENPSRELQRAFLSAVASGRRAALQSTLADAAKTWTVMDAAQRAMRGGKTARVSDAE